MDTKLTLRLNHNVIGKAKLYARNHNVSLSRLIESYLDRITEQKEGAEKASITQLVESLSGVIDLPTDYNYKMEYRDYLEKKYR